MSVSAARRRLNVEPSELARRAAPGAVIIGCGCLLGLLAAGPGTWIAAGVVAGVALLMAVAAIWGFEGVLITLLVGSMLPLPAAPVGSVAFPLATVAVLMILGGAVVVTRRRGMPVRVPHLSPYLLLIGVAVISLVASWLFWDSHVATGSERGFGHRSIGYQLTGLYLLAVPLLALSGGVISSRLVRISHVYGWVFAGLTGLTLFVFSTWLQHPSNPIDAFSNQTRLDIDYQWSTFLVVTAAALTMYAGRRWLRRLGTGLLLLGLATALIQYVLSAWLAILAAITVMIWYRYRARGVILWVAAVVIAGLILESTVATIFIQRATSADVDRVKIWSSAITIWTKAPVIGVGPGNLASYMEAYSAFPLGLVLQGYQQAHNIFLEILSEEGVVGLTLLAVFLALVVRTLSRFKATARAEQSFAVTAALGLLVAAAVIASFGGGFIPTIASAGYNALPMVLLEWFLIGCGLGVAQRLRSSAT